MSDKGQKEGDSIGLEISMQDIPYRQLASLAVHSELP